MTSQDQLKHLTNDELIAELARRNGCRVVVISRDQYYSTLKELNELADKQIEAYSGLSNSLVNLFKEVEA